MTYYNSLMIKGVMFSVQSINYPKEGKIENFEISRKSLAKIDTFFNV